MEENRPEETKTSLEVTASSLESLKMVQDKHGRDLVLVPQPTDDPDDPLVRNIHELIGWHS